MQPRCFQHRGCIISARGWYVDCSDFEMLNTLTTAAFTFVFLGIVVGLGAAFVLMFWEVERQLAKPHRNRDRLG